MEGMEGDPLLSLGLVDPRGNAVPTADWSGPDSNKPGEQTQQNTDSRVDPTGDPVAAPATPGAAPAAGGQATIDWDSASNPYRPDPVTQSRQTYESQVTQLQREVPAAIAVLMSQGFQQPQAEAMVNAALSAGVANARVQADRIAMLPYAKQASAEQIAKQFSTSSVPIDPKELVNEPTADAMQTKARTIVAERRDRVVNTRAATGADRVERTGASASIDYSTLSPHSMISLGIRRGQ